VKTLILLSLALLSLNSFALDLAFEHQALCESAEAKTLIGANGSCRIVFGTAQASETQGVCIGKFRNAMPCRVTYLATADMNGLQIICGTDAQNPALNQTVRAQASSYTVAAVINKEDQSQVVINDKSANIVLDSSALSVVLSKQQAITKARIFLNLKSGPEELNSVQCY
jgi:hypothetical protein